MLKLSCLSPFERQSLLYRLRLRLEKKEKEGERARIHKREWRRMKVSFLPLLLEQQFNLCLYKWGEKALMRNQTKPEPKPARTFRINYTFIYICTSTFHAQTKYVPTYMHTLSNSINRIISSSWWPLLLLKQERRKN